MNIKSNLTFLLACVSLAFFGCFSFGGGGSAVITLNLRGSPAAGRTAVFPPDEAVMSRLAFTADFSGPSGDIRRTAGGGVESIQVEVDPGRWNIEVRAFLDERLYAEGSASADIRAGEHNPVRVEMRQVVWPAFEVVISVGPGTGDDLPERRVEIGAHEPLTVTVEGVYVAYRWYVDGALQANEASAEYVFSAAPGVYELAVVVTGSDGEKRSGRCWITVR